MGKLSKRQIGIITISALAIILLVLIVASLVYSGDDSSESGSTGSGGTSSSGSSSGGTSSGGSSSGGTSSGGSSSGDCIPPDPVTTGYDISNVTGSLSKDSFSITGVTCATGYTGTEPRAIACGTVGGEYTLSGCSVSTQPVGSGGGTEDSSSTNPCSLANVMAPTDGPIISFTPTLGRN